MTHRFADAISAFGSEMLLITDQFPDGHLFHGILQPSETAAPNPHKSVALSGVYDSRKFSLFAPPDLFMPDAVPPSPKIVAFGDLFLVLRAEPIHLRAAITHWECVLRRIGRADYD